jgi:(p)ppGpp synthase/HD superfamily hydrolase
MLELDLLDYFYRLHDVTCNQKYGKTLPYSFHLKNTVSFAYKFEYLIPEEDRFYVRCGTAGHDAIEDARITFNDIVEISNSKLAEIIYACTEDKGKNRSERHSDKYFKELRKNKLAVFVKLCDMMANSTFSLATNSSMFKKYKEEFIVTRKVLYCPEYDEMFTFLDNLYNIQE